MKWLYLRHFLILFAVVGLGLKYFMIVVQKFLIKIFAEPEVFEDSSPIIVEMVLDLLSTAEIHALIIIF